MKRSVHARASVPALNVSPALHIACRCQFLHTRTHLKLTLVTAPTLITFTLTLTLTRTLIALTRALALSHMQLTDSGDDLAMYFSEPQQLLDIFADLELQNLFLIQNSQETEQALEELKQNYQETKKQMDDKTSSLKVRNKGLPCDADVNVHAYLSLCL